MKSEELTTVVSDILKALSAGETEKHSAISDVMRGSSVVSTALDRVLMGDYVALEFSISYPISQGIKALAGEKGLSDRSWFLVENSRFFESQFSALFSKFEGRICCVDKARTIIRKLIKHFNTGAQIELDYSQEYTFGLPGLILKDHDAILGMYLAIESLYFGNTDRYLTELLKLHKAGTN